MSFYCSASYVYKTYIIDIYPYMLILTDRLCSLERCPLTASMRKYLMCTWYSCRSSPDVALEFWIVNMAWSSSVTVPM